MTERYVVKPWPHQRSDSSCGRALVLPGSGYTVDHPLLFWSCQVLAEAGWDVITMRWDAADVTTDDCRRFVETGADLLDGQLSNANHTLVVAKSLGSFAAAWASARKYPAIWLTPVMTDPFVAAALRRYAAPSLLVGGTTDPLWSRPPEQPSDQQVLEVPEADHALHSSAGWRKSLDVLHETLTAVEAFAASVADQR